MSCLSKGAHLLSVANLNETQNVEKLITDKTKKSKYIWIGGNKLDPHSGWSWSDGQPFSFINWDVRGPGVDNVESNEDDKCLSIATSTGKWIARPCSTKMPYICKKMAATQKTQTAESKRPDNIPNDMIWGCPLGWSGFGDSCYQVQQLTPEKQSYDEAKYLCGRSYTPSPNVVDIENSAENYFVFTLLSKQLGPAWIGINGTRTSDGSYQFKMKDGPQNYQDLRFSNWNTGHPVLTENRTCVQVTPQSGGKWETVDCNQTLKYTICKTEKDKMKRSNIQQSKWCLKGGFDHGRMCYKYFIPKKTFSDSQEVCKTALGGNLAAINDSTIQSFVVDNFKASITEAYWIKQTDKKMWPTGFEAEMDNWNSEFKASEGSACVAIMTSNNHWYLYNCDTILSYVCEYPREFPTTTTTTTTTTITAPPCPCGLTDVGDDRYTTSSLLNALVCPTNLSCPDVNSCEETEATFYNYNGRLCRGCDQCADELFPSVIG